VHRVTRDREALKTDIRRLNKPFLKKCFLLNCYEANIVESLFFEVEK
jgi:hypothetical protein